MTITRAQVRAELYNTVPGLGFVGTADSVTTTTLTDSYALRDSTLGANHYRGVYIYRPSASVTDDLIRKANTLTPSTGAIVHSGLNYGDTTTLGYEIVGPLHPDELNSCITRAMRMAYYEFQTPLTGGVVNGDMELGTTGWTGSSATPSAVTTASRVFSGTTALRVANSGSNGYAASGAIKVFPNEPFYASAVCSVESGTANLVVYDNTNSAVVGSAVATGDAAFSHLFIVSMIPSGCESVSIRLRGVESNADVYWNHALFYRLEQLVLLAPSWLDEPYKFLKLREAEYRKSIANQSNGGQNDANSRYFKDWIQPNMFSLDPLKLDANPYQVQLQKALPKNEMWIQAKRPYSDAEDLSTEGSSSHAPLDLITAYARLELAKVLRKRYPTDKRWEVMISEGAEDVSAQTTSRPEIPLQPIKRDYMGKI